jgi:hypothetical protein
VASTSAVTARLGNRLGALAAAVLGLGLAHCSTDLGDLMKGDGSDSNKKPLGQAPGWSRPYPVEGRETPGEIAPETPGGKEPGTNPGTGPTNPEELVGFDRWCTSRKATFCADFDEPMPLERFSAGVAGQTVPVVDPGFDVSAPFAMLIDVPETLNRVDTFSSRITHHFSQRVDGFLLDFELSPELVNESRAAVAALDFVGNGAATYSLRLVYEGGSLHLDEVAQSSSRRLASTTPPSGPQRWSHIKLDVDFANLPSASFTLVDDPSLAETLVGSAALSPTPGMSYVPSLSLGIVEGQRPHNGWKLRYDNVALELR